MNHITEEELIEYYYGEIGHKAGIERHLKVCKECSGAFASLSKELADIKRISPPVRDAGYGEQVWQSLRHSLPAYEKTSRRWRSYFVWNALALATLCALLLAFLAGRQWQRKQIDRVAENIPQARERVVFVVLGDHLDRSERLLVELKHAGDGPATPLLRAEAQDLLTANRLYRESAAQAGDPALAAALDHLERALVEVANEPGDLSPSDVAQIQKEMNTDGLLFEVRVLRSRVQAQQQGRTVPSKGVSL
jgi:hypothetical protein